MLHANDNRGDRDDHLPPGEGHIDWLSLVCQLIKWRFQGPLILELAGHGTPDEIMERARRALEFLNGGELFTLLCLKSRLSNDAARALAGEVVHIFDYIHSKDIIYR